MGYLLDPAEQAETEREFVKVVGIERFRELAGRDPLYMTPDTAQADAREDKNQD